MAPLADATAIDPGPANPTFAWDALEDPDMTSTLRAHEQAYGRFRENRYSNRVKGPFKPMRHWPGARYLATGWPSCTRARSCG